MSVREQRVALRNSGLIDPKDIGSYIERGRGYSRLTRALKSGAEGTLAALEKCGLAELRGPRPVAVRWAECKRAGGQAHYVICEAIDMDPLAPTAKLLLATDPHSVLEGLLIAAVAVGAECCFICVNEDYMEEKQILEAALEQLRDRGLLGDDVLGSGISLDVNVTEVRRTLFAGEETALIRALEGAQPLPYLRGPDAAWAGLYGHPTLVEDAETLAKVSGILDLESFAGECPRVIGAAGEAVPPDENDEAPFSVDASCEATKIVTVAGDVDEVRTVEVPLGTTVRTVLEHTLGTSSGGTALPPVQFGGPMGCLLTGESLDMPISAQALASAGCVMGSGGIRVLEPGSCAVELARDLTAALHEESCGKCVFCREGTRQIVGLLDDVAQGESGGESAAEQMSLLRELCTAMRTSSICALGREAPVPVLCALDVFEEDFEAHLQGRPCPKAVR